MGKRRRPRGRAARGTFELFTMAVPSRAAHSERGRLAAGEAAGSGSRAGPTPRERG